MKLLLLLFTQIGISQNSIVKELLAEGEKAYFQNDFLEAKEIFTKATNIDSTNKDCWHVLHKGAIQVGDLQSITFDQAIKFLANDVLEAERSLNQRIENMRLTGRFGTSQYFALVDMTFNAGLGNDDNKTITYQVLTAMKTQGVKAANDICIKFYTNETAGEQDRKYFEAQAFIYGRSITPEQAKAELIALGIKK